MNVGVVIPSYNQRASLTALLDRLELEPEVKRVVVLDNGYDPPLHREEESFIEVYRDETPSIYHLWNRGAAILRNCDAIVYLNDDVELIGANWIYRLVAPLTLDGWWITSPACDDTPPGEVRSVRGTFRHGGMLGYAFAFQPIRFGPKPFDERYSWWYGDDVFAFLAEDRGGRIGRVGGLHLHHEESATLNSRDVSEAIGHDTRLFTEEWGLR